MLVTHAFTARQSLEILRFRTLVPRTQVASHESADGADAQDLLDVLTVTSILTVLRINAAIVVGILASAIVAMITGLADFQGVLGLPDSLTAGLFAADFKGLFQQQDVFAVVFVIFFVDLFDTVGTLIGVSERAGLSVAGQLPRAREAFLADAAGSVVGGLAGTSTVTELRRKRRGRSRRRPHRARFGGDGISSCDFGVPLSLAARGGWRP